MEGNLWLKKYTKILPFSMFPDKLVADREYPGTEIRFKTTWPNPENPERGMLILTAQNTFNLLRCGDVGSGSTDYTVIDGWKVIKYGYYKKEGKKWSF